jgi:hypothetical protein
MIPPNNVLKRRLKYGPKFHHREMRALFSGFLVDAGPRTLTPGAQSKIRSELARLEASGNSRVQRFVREMYLRYPGVKQ